MDPSNQTSPRKRGTKPEEMGLKDELNRQLPTSKPTPSASLPVSADISRVSAPTGLGVISNPLPAIADALQYLTTFDFSGFSTSNGDKPAYTFGMQALDAPSITSPASPTANPSRISTPPLEITEEIRTRLIAMRRAVRKREEEEEREAMASMTMKKAKAFSGKTMWNDIDLRQLWNS
ncbi:hypothetical protein BJ508DRAFT_310378 [Ascobolus immersus RN42]|uniref:Uncharacterized protein n=1 Tax=Ascobolus immersus RN42 TaxID=1160509 RepID=A0A3N4I5T6_ASCIM|nr:hypothetical protein BJ508DRAFT_310378 [Ascobolus immersus RN42]